jgi:hypothetical protein
LLATRLIFVDGIVGAGKTTTAHWIADQMALSRPAVEVVAEGDRDLRVGVRLEHGLKPWLDVSADEYVRLSLQAWSRVLVRWGTAPIVRTVDGLLFHGNMADLLLMDAPSETLAGYVNRLIEIVRPQAPAVVYLRVPDVVEAVQRVLAERGAKWKDYQFGWKLSSPYAERRGLVGIDGFVRLCEAQQAVADDVFQNLDLPKLLVELPSDFERKRVQIKEFLGL